jgi:hypothetical protein
MFIDRVSVQVSSPFGSAELLRLDQAEISALPNGDDWIRFIQSINMAPLTR